MAMAHIHTDDGQHDLTVSMYLIRTDFDQPKLMLHRHKKFEKLMQFGGHVELDENPWQAVRHELVEETGYELEQLKVLQSSKTMPILDVGHSVLHPQPAFVNTHPASSKELNGRKHYHMDLGYVFVTDQPPTQAPAEGESIDIEMFTRNELSKLGDSMFNDTVAICDFIFDECLPKWHQVSTSSFKS